MLRHPDRSDLLAGRILALPDDATVLIRIGVTFRGEAEHGARLVQTDEFLELGVLGIEHEGLDQAGTGLVETLMLDPEYAELKELIGLDKTSSVLCFSTEGDTDPDQYRRIVWEGEYPTC